MSDFSYSQIARRIDEALAARGNPSVRGIDADRLTEIRTSARNISTLELTYIHRALCLSIEWMVFGAQIKRKR